MGSTSVKICVKLTAERLGNIDLRDKQWLKLFYSDSATLLLSKTCSFPISFDNALIYRYIYLFFLHYILFLFFKMGKL